MTRIRWWAIHAIVGALSVVSAYAGEIPKAVWRPSIKDGYAQVRFTPDGSRLTIMTSSGLQIVDMKTRECVYVDDYAISNHDDSATGTLARSAISESGEYVVALYRGGKVRWRRVADTAVVSEIVLPQYQYENMHSIHDTTVYVERNDSGYHVSLNGTVTSSRWTSSYSYPISDSLNAIVQGSLMVGIVHAATGDTLARMTGYYMGIDLAHRLYVYKDTMLIRYNSVSPFTADTVMKTVNAYLILRNQFFHNGDTLVDLSDDSRHPLQGWPIDILHDRTVLYRDVAASTLTITHPTKTADTMYLFNGPVIEVVQDPRDSLTFVLTQGQGVSGMGYSAMFGVLTDVSTFLVPAGYAGKMNPPKMIRDSLCSVYSTNNMTSYYGYRNLDRVRARKSANGLEIARTFDIPDRPQYDFSSTGDTLRSYMGIVKYSGCPTVFNTGYAKEIAGVTGFVPGTSFYVDGLDLYDAEDCGFHIVMENSVIDIATHNMFVLSASADSVNLYDVKARRKHASISSQLSQLGAWSDSGRTYRLVRDGHTIISMHADGTTDSIVLPSNMRGSEVTWQWSNDGNVATGIKRDTLISIDVRTGQLLREYYEAPWLPYRNATAHATSVVGPVDGRLVVSLPGGSVATFPGISLPVISSVSSDPRRVARRPLTLEGTRIVGARAYSSVTVYSLIGTVVLQTSANDNGALDLGDKGLTHGAYIIVWSDGVAMQSAGVIL